MATGSCWRSLVVVLVVLSLFLLWTLLVPDPEHDESTGNTGTSAGVVHTLSSKVSSDTVATAAHLKPPKKPPPKMLPPPPPKKLPPPPPMKLPSPPPMKLPPPPSPPLPMKLPPPPPKKLLPPPSMKPPPPMPMKLPPPPPKKLLPPPPPPAEKQDSMLIICLDAAASAFALAASVFLAFISSGVAPHPKPEAHTTFGIRILNRWLLHMRLRLAQDPTQHEHPAARILRLLLEAIEAFDVATNVPVSLVPLLLSVVCSVVLANSNMLFWISEGDSWYSILATLVSSSTISTLTVAFGLCVGKIKGRYWRWAWLATYGAAAGLSGSLLAMLYRDQNERRTRAADVYAAMSIIPILGRMIARQKFPRGGREFRFFSLCSSGSAMCWIGIGVVDYSRYKRRLTGAVVVLACNLVYFLSLKIRCLANLFTKD